MKLAKKAFVISLTILALMLTVSAQTLRSELDPRNTAPTVGTGGPVGGPTGLFTVYDGQTLRKGEFTFSVAYSNYDRDPGDVDIVEVPLSFQIGLNDYIELFFNTDGYRGVKVNSPGNLSSFFLPNATFFNRPAMVLAPGSGALAGRALFRPAGNQAFTAFPFSGGPAGGFGFNCNAFPQAVDRNQCLAIFQTQFGSALGSLTLGAGTGGGNGAANFPGIGSVYGSILPGVVFQTVNVPTGGVGGVGPGNVAPSVFALAPSYLPDAPFIGRTYGESAFNTFTIGGKIRFSGPNSPIGIGIIPFYRFYADDADDANGFTQLQRGASPGGGGGIGGGDIGLVGFADARLRKWVNVSANIGYIYNSDVESNGVTILDRGDELIAAIGVDFPVNKYFQPILEIRSLQYVGGRTPNAFENDPIDGLAGVRIFPTRWMGFSVAYRYHANQQDRDSFDGSGTASINIVGGRTGGTAPFNFPAVGTSFTGVPPGFRTSSDPHGFIGQFFIGRRNARQAEILNVPAVINSVDLGSSTVKLPCEGNLVPREGETCPDDQTVSIRTNATDKENDVLTYNYTVSGGRIVGQGANVSWDLSGVQPGTYTVTVGVDDGCGVCSETKTETVTVERCDCVEPPVECDCPSLNITAPPSAVNPGENLTFTANLVGGSQTGLTYSWSVDKGEIISGQGTPTITVSTTGLSDENVSATVNVSGYTADCDCPETATELGIVAGLPQPELIDEFGPLANNDVKARIDNLFIRLQGDPAATGYIINYGSARQVAARERVIRNHIRDRGYDASRIVFVNGGVESDIRTRLWIVPQGADPSTVNE